jgi:hypothetical protein
VCVFCGYLVLGLASGLEAFSQEPPCDSIGALAARQTPTGTGDRSWRPSESSVQPVLLGVSTPGLYSSDWLLAQSCWPLTVSPALVGQSHFAVSRFLGCVVFLQKASLATVKSPVEILSRVSPPLRVAPSCP